MLRIPAYLLLAAIRLRLAGMLTLLIAMPPGLATEPAQESMYRVGVAKIDITPTFPVLLSGYAARPQQLTLEVSQPLVARAMAIETELKNPVVLIAVDNCGVPATVRRAVAAELNRLFEIAPERVTITSTHTHSAPMLTAVLNNLPVRDLDESEQGAVDRYTQELTQKLIKVAGDAIQSRSSVSLSLTYGQVDFAMNRRGAAVVDHRLPLLIATDADGKRQAIITNYACHCVAAGSGMNMCGDWAGYAAEAIEAANPDATAIVLIGCGADQNPKQRNSLAAAQEHGRSIATEITRLLGEPLLPIAGKIDAKFSEIKLPLADLPSSEEWEVRAKEKGITGYHAKKNLDRILSGETLPNEILYPVQTWTFGDDLAMVFLGGEVVVDYSHELRKSLDADRLWVTAYANDVACYIPSERVLQEGGYEGGGAMVWYDQPAVFVSGLQKRIVDEVSKQLGGVFDADHDATRTGGIHPMSPEDSIHAMQTHDQLRVELVAAEPLIADPVAIDFGHDGKLWVVEMHDYPEGVDGKYKPGGRVKFLEDADGDGRYDRATTFLDGLAFPTGVTPWRNGVLICAAPDVLYAEDTNGDGKADSVRKVLSGFYTENFQARVNGLSLGLDNWIHGAAGIFGGKLTTASGTQVDSSNRDFRFHPDTDAIEPVSGRSQQGRVRDDWGNWFGCDNSNLLFHFPTTDHYHRRNPHVAATNPSLSIAASRTLFPTGPLVQWALSGPPGKPTAACGVGIYRDVLLGEDYSNNSFTCEPVNQLVHRLQIVPNGLTFTGQRSPSESDREFLSSTDRWFRPVQAKTGPDGALYVVDMYRYMIEHPRFLTESARAEIDVRAGDQRGRIYRVVPKSFVPTAIPNLINADTTELVELLNVSNGTLRDMAHLQLVWRRDPKAVPLLKVVAEQAELPQSRIQALALLDAFGAVTAGLIADALPDKHPGVRRHAVRLAEPLINQNEAIAKQCVELADDPDGQVRMQLAYSLGQWNHPDAGRVLMQMALNAPTDKLIKDAIFSSLNRANIATALATMLKQLKDGDNARPLAGEILSLTVKMGDDQSLVTAIDRVVEPKNGEYANWQWTLMPSLMQSLNARSLPLDDERLKSWNLMTDKAIAIAGNVDKSDELRAMVISLLPHIKGNANSMIALSEILHPQSSVQLQQAAVIALASTNSATSASILFDNVARLTPAVQATVLDEAVARTAFTSELIARLESGNLPRGLIDPSRRQTLANHPDAEIKARWQALFTTATSDQIAEVIAGYKSIDPSRGDKNLGKEVFKKQCAACHRVDTIGHVVGPDLMALTDRSKQAFLTAILDPNAAIDQRYATYSAITNQGVIVTGIIESESYSSITLKAQDGKQHVILRSDLEALQSTGVSLMPEGMNRLVPPHEMKDLLAFLGAGGNKPTYTFVKPGGPGQAYSDDRKHPKLTDANFGSDVFKDGTWVGFKHSADLREHQIVFDLSDPTEIRALRITYGVNQRPGGIHAPNRVVVAFSADGQEYSNAVEANNLDDSPDGLGVYQLSRRTANIKIEATTARFVRIGITNSAEWTFLSEIEINPVP